MNGWCSSNPRNWTWSPTPYLGAWAILLSVIGLAAWWRIRGRHQEIEIGDRERAQLDRGSGEYQSSGASRAVAFGFGIVGLWATLDWPLAALGAGYLASAQMVRQILMVMVVAPLLLYSMPGPLAIRVVGWGRRLWVLRWTARPIIAIPVAALTLIAVNAPAILDPLVKTPYGSFVLDLMWITAGFVLWMPVQCPHPAVKRLVGPIALTYLVLQSVVPVLPGFFMTWADYPIYEVYELAPRAIEGFDAINDQQAAAAILQVGGMVVLWVQISFRFLNWAYQQMEQDRRRPSGGKPIAGAAVGAP
jgi:cytochrome c oxidase assembly factor CtaG